MPEDTKTRHREPLFLESDPRFVYARDKRRGDDAPLVFLPDGGAETLRSDSREGHLWCPFPGCGVRFVTTRSGKRRHCFVHESGARESVDVHHPETYFHLLGKDLVFQWARQRYPSAQVQQEVKVENGQQPDVLVTLGGRRFAFEIQYSALAPEEPQRRHKGYRDLGIIDVWLLGHRPPHLVNARHHSEELPLVEMGQAQRRLIELGAQCFWIAPEGMEGGAIATAWTMSRRQVHQPTLKTSDERHRLPLTMAWDEWTWQHPPSQSDNLMHFDADALSECSLEGQRFVTPTLRRLWEEQARIDALTSQRIDTLRREAEAQRPTRTDPPPRADPPTAQGSLFPQGSSTEDGTREDLRKRPDAPSAHSIHSTLAALQKYPWFIVKTRTLDYFTRAEEITFEVRDKIQVGSQEGTRRPVGSMEEGIAWVKNGGHEVIVLDQEVVSLKGSPFMWAPPIPLNWTLDGTATRRRW
ncbi:competence protein CoiA family protein [Corallococcus sp. BB11-1]|uniref:competence protein CoiA family protein n=1 Tax=Corallococcus sp. BB11-1 TaxID=2996783 RepID=UPI00226D50F1|nr:competence protein CoiA family protein [Corallococcus sp. BB11-1]MCY1030341.1 competence protein CoiA family protein [Corallococcus sp. BB11-1]